jgi:hypothetical protein
MALKRWIWWVLGILAFFGFIAMAGIGACVYLVASHLDTKDVTATQAEAEFEAIRSRFKDQKPLLEIRRNGQVLVDRLEERAATYKGAKPESLRILAWERGESKRVRITLPLWLLRIKGTMDLKSNEVGLEKLNIKVEDLERAGPALLVDHTDGQHRLLVWTQ